MILIDECSEPDSGTQFRQHKPAENLRKTRLQNEPDDSEDGVKITRKN